MQIVWDFIAFIEKDKASIDHIIIQFINAQNQLLKMPTFTAHEMALSLRLHFLNTCPLQRTNN